MMNPSISFIILLLYVVGFVIAEYRAEYRINYGVQNYTRLIDEFSIVAPAQQYRNVRMNFDYPGGLVCLQHFSHSLFGIVSFCVGFCP